MQGEVESCRYAGFVNAQVREAYDTGLPTHVLDDRYAIVGAQPHEVLVRALELIKREQL
jgi:predicted DsbA family dithiol-disulfide isomerase